MEYIIGLCIIIVLLLLIGVKSGTIIAGIFLLLCAVLLLLLIFFAYSMFRLVTSKRLEADFLKTDKAPKGEFKVAYYLCEGKEYPCAFPAEPFFEKKFYPSHKKHKVMLNRKTKTVYDRYAAVTCAVGFVFSLSLVLLLLYILLLY